MLALLAMMLASIRTDADSPPAVAETTVVKGRIPDDLVGRWFVVHDARLPTGKLRPFGRLIEVRPGTEHVELHLHRVEPPDVFKRSLDRSAVLNQPWEPGRDELDGLKEQWDELTPIPGDLDHIENELYAPDAFTEDMKRDEETRGSDLAIVTKEIFSGAQPVKSTIAVYGIRDKNPAEFAGSFVSTSIATAPFPVPITLRGVFRAYRVGPLPERSWMARVLDLFRGCGRR
jgi:hypothetical protein